MKMDTTSTRLTEEATRRLEEELETWDWARTAGVSADDLRQALRAELGGPGLRKAA